MKYETLMKKKLVEGNISYGVMANLCGMSRTTIINYATGKRIPNWEDGIKIAHILDVGIFDFVRLFKPCD